MLSNSPDLPAAPPVIFVVFGYRNVPLLSKLLKFLDHSNSIIYIHWDSKSDVELGLPHLEKARVIKVRPEVNISWGGNGVIKVQRQILQEIHHEAYSHVLFLTEDCMPIKRYEDIVTDLRGLNFFSLEKAQKVSCGNISLVNFLPKNALRTRSMLASFHFLISRIMPGFKFKGNWYRGRGWLCLSKKHVQLLNERKYFLTPRELFWLENFSFLSEEYFLQTALFRGVPHEIIPRRLVFANYSSANPNIITKQELKEALETGSLFVRKASCESWKAVNW